MGAPEVAELLKSAAPTPMTTLDIDAIRSRANRRRRRRRRHGAVGTGLLLVGAVALGLTGLLSASPGRQTVIAGPPSSRAIPIRVGAGTATMDIGLLDGTRLRLTLPEAMGDAFSGVTFSDLGLHGSVYAGLGSQPGWRIDVTLGTIDTLVVGG